MLCTKSRINQSGAAKLNGLRHVNIVFHLLLMFSHLAIISWHRYIFDSQVDCEGGGNGGRGGGCQAPVETFVLVVMKHSQNVAYFFYSFFFIITCRFFDTNSNLQQQLAKDIDLQASCADKTLANVGFCNQTISLNRNITVS